MTKFPHSRIRHDLYFHNRKYAHENGEDMDDFASYPYTFLKSRFYIECAAIIVSALQLTRIKPNQLTFFGAALGPLCITCFYLASLHAYLLGLFIIVFLKGVIDWSDGALARVKGSCSELGAVLDSWSATVNSYSFQICIGLFVYNMTGDTLFILLSIATIFVRAADLRLFVHATIGAEFFSGVDLSARMIGSESGARRFVANKSRLAVPFQIVTKVLDDRARMVDFICLLILIELILENVYFSHILVFLILLGSIVRLLAGFYIICYDYNSHLRR